MKIKNICCIGAGFVGGPTMAVIASQCPKIKITVVDKNIDKISRWNENNLNNLPVFEPGLKQIISEVRNVNLFFSNDIEQSIVESEMIFLAVNTPTKEKGEGAGMAADLKHIISCAKTIARVSKSNKIVVEKSTLPVRTAEKLKEILEKNKRASVRFDVISNPEFLAEGTAIRDLFKSDRVLIGGDQSKSGKKAVKSLVDIYSAWIPKRKILTVNVWSSELSKLVSNAMLAQRISSINSISALSKKTEADIDEISIAVGMDKRIGEKFLKVSPGFGGSCFKKDVLNLVYLCKHYGLDEVAEYWYSIIKINDYQRKRIVNIVDQYVKENKEEKRITILGWSFKKDTNDSRESSSIYIANEFLKKDYNISVFDPRVGIGRIRQDLKFLNRTITDSNSEIKIKSVETITSLSEVENNSRLVIVLTEWDEFKRINKEKNDLKIFDFRNYLDPNKIIYRF